MISNSSGTYRLIIDVIIIITCFLSASRLWFAFARLSYLLQRNLATHSDLYAAFDTIDHQILRHCSDKCFSITDIAPTWMDKYLTDRYRQVKLEESLTPKICQQFEAHQGSILGPLLLTLHTTSLNSNIQGHQTDHLLHADDRQLYVSFHLHPLFFIFRSVLTPFKTGWYGIIRNSTQAKLSFCSLVMNSNAISASHSFPVCLLLGRTGNYYGRSRNRGVICDQIFTSQSEVPQMYKLCFTTSVICTRKHVAL